MDNRDLLEYIDDRSPLLRFLVIRDLLDEEPESSPYEEALNKALADPFLLSLKEELRSWPGPVLKRHNDAKLLLHKMAFVAELDLPDITFHSEITNLVSERMTAEGIVPVLVNIPKQFGGTGKDSFSWMLCDAPLLMYNLVRLGADKSDLAKGIESLAGLGQDFGFPCSASPDLGRFNGPGKRGTVCPYATLLMLRLFSVLPRYYEDRRCISAGEMILNHIEAGGRPYLFGAGTDFRKLKFPYIWYDTLHVAEILSRFPRYRKDGRLREMVDVILSKVDDAGLYKAESVWMAWKGIDAGQKKVPSLWITYCVRKIIKRMNQK